MPERDNEGLSNPTPEKPADNINSWLQQAQRLIKCGELEQAEAMYRFLIEAGVQSDKVYINLACLCQLKGAFPESLTLLDQALEICPLSTEAHLNIANALEFEGKYDSAVRKIKYVLMLDDSYAEAHHNMGFLLARMGDDTAAAESYNRAIEIKPAYPDAYNNLGNALRAIGDLDGAMTAYNQAINLKPNFVDAHVNRALAILSRGNYEEGWKEYEWRLQRETEKGAARSHSSSDYARWRDASLNPANHILLEGEQGLGDTIQLIRYVKLLRARGHQITVAIQEKLHGILRCSAMDAQLVNPEDLALHNKGCRIPLFSLPGLLHVTPDEPLVTRPYLNSDALLIAKWRSKLESEARPIIAINWQGNPDAERAALKWRSFALEKLAPLANKLQGSLLSLQKGYGSEQLENCSFQDSFVRCQQDINASWDFLDVSAIISNCDLVITSDTCVAHLAGAMGQPTWLLLAKVPDWRWGLDGDSSFWYPSMRLFRQRVNGDWDEVMERVAEAFGEFLADSSSGA
jgi:tetratricopeptide (TPR) repeat protein